MILDVDFLIDYFKKHTNEDSKGEMGEQDAPAAASAPSGGGGSIPKWADTYTLTRGKANNSSSNDLHLFFVLLKNSLVMTF